MIPLAPDDAAIPAVAAVGILVMVMVSLPLVDVAAVDMVTLLALPQLVIVAFAGIPTPDITAPTSDDAKKLAADVTVVLVLVVPPVVVATALRL